MFTMKRINLLKSKKKKKKNIDVGNSLRFAESAVGIAIGTQILKNIK